MKLIETTDHMQNIRNRKVIQYAFVSALLLFNTSNASSQTEGNDIVVLKNGMTHQGTIIEQRPGHFLKLLQTPSSDTLTLTYSDIESLKIVPSEDKGTTSPNLASTPTNSEKPQFNLRPYYLTLSASVGVGDWVDFGYQIGLIRTFTPRIQAGLCAGIHITPDVPVWYNSIPILAQFKYAIQKSPKERTAIMVSLSAGYNVYWNSRHFEDIEETNEEYVQKYITNGIHLYPSIGYRVNFTKNSGFILDLGYQYMGGKVRRESNDEFLKRNHLSNLTVKGTIFF